MLAQDVLKESACNLTQQPVFFIVTPSQGEQSTKTSTDSQKERLSHAIFQLGNVNFAVNSVEV